MTDGEREIDGRQFYLRLAQRIMHLFSTRTSSGILYEVDARLRPSGAAGMLVTTADAFADYQQNEAWTWEHQALVRARVVYGDPALQARFDAIRRDILTTPREGATLQTEVREMREKMRAHLGNKHPNRFDIKADGGGITDIEFITQYLVLRYASDKPKLTRWSDNVRILELLAQNDIMDEEEARALTHAYTTLRDALHHGPAGAAGTRGARGLQPGARAGQRQLAEMADGLTIKSGVLLSRAKFASRRRES